MEHKFLELMQYRAVVTQGLYARYYFELRALFEQLLRQSRSQAARPFPLQPLRLWEARKLEVSIRNVGCVHVQRNSCLHALVSPLG